MIIGLSFFVYLVSVPEYYTYQQQIIGNPQALFISIYESITVVACFVIAAIIFLYKRNDFTALGTALALALYGIWIVRPMNALYPPSPLPQLLFTILPTYTEYVFLSCIRMLEQVLVVIFCCTFPSGRFFPTWTRLVTISWITIKLIWLLFQQQCLVSMEFIH